MLPHAKGGNSGNLKSYYPRITSNKERAATQHTRQERLLHKFVVFTVNKLKMLSHATRNQ